MLPKSELAGTGLSKDDGRQAPACRHRRSLRLRPSARCRRRALRCSSSFRPSWGRGKSASPRSSPSTMARTGWSVEAEILVPNLEVKMLGLPLTQEVLEREHYSVELETDLTVRSYGYVGADDD